MVQERTDVVVEGPVREPRQHVPLAVVARRQKLPDMVLSGYDIEVVVKDNEFEHALMGFCGIVGKAVSPVQRSQPLTALTKAPLVPLPHLPLLTSFKRAPPSSL